MKDDRRNLPTNDFDGNRNNSFLGDFTKEKKWLIIKLLIVIIPGILYWVTSDDNFEKKVSVNVAVDAGISSKKTDAQVEPPKIVEEKNNPPPVVQSDNTNNILLAQQKFEEGYAADQRKDYVAAINFYNQAIELNQNHARAYHNRGLDYQNTQNFGLALVDLDRAIQLEPYSAFMYNTRGVIYRNLKNFAQAIQNYDKAIQLNPNYTEAYSNRALAYVDLKNYNSAIPDCNSALKINEKNADAYLFRAISYGCLQNFNQAISDANTAIQLKENFSTPTNLAVAYQCRGVCYQALGETEKAQADLNQAKILGYKEN